MLHILPCPAKQYSALDRFNIPSGLADVLGMGVGARAWYPTARPVIADLLPVHHGCVETVLRQGLVLLVVEVMSMFMTRVQTVTRMLEGNGHSLVVEEDPGGGGGDDDNVMMVRTPVAIMALLKETDATGFRFSDEMQERALPKH